MIIRKIEINKTMRIIEILLPKVLKDKELSSATLSKIDLLQRRMDSYVDKIFSPNTSPAGKEFLKSRLRDDYYELKDLLRPLHRIDTVVENKKAISEAVHKLPLKEEDFELVKTLLEKPIPAVVAPIYISEVIDDDELNDQIRSFEETEPGRDIRPLVVEWLKRVMPDQMHRFGQEVADEYQRKGVLSPIHGYDPKQNRSRFTTPISGGAYGRY